ncbi:Hypothetical protein PBC10988_40920 [Planctomycetales bacterium 10988]|nr:Hypothetical protein PBC10988_40920 [Planctomycetales bacterium 10988]
MNSFSSYCDDFYLTMNLSTEMELPQNRETVLTYFERVQKQYPSMRNFYSREKGDFVLEEDKDNGQYRWTTIESRRISSGVVNPESEESAIEQHRLVLDVAPAYLTVSPLDCEALDLLYGFDFNYRGNHSQLVTEALGISPSLEKLIDFPGATIINHEPGITLALDEACRMQCRLSIETRTNAYQIRTGDFPDDQITVYFTARQYGSLQPNATFVDSLNKLYDVCREMMDTFVIAQVLQPLAQAISLK